MHYKEITELAIEKNLLSHVGKSPEVTMGARLAALLKKEDKTNPIVRVKPGVFGLRDWSDKKPKRGSKDEEAPAALEEDALANRRSIVDVANARGMSAEALEIMLGLVYLDYTDDPDKEARGRV